MPRLKVPENISLHWQLWQGFGKRETIITSIALGISVPCAVAYVRISGWTLAPLIAVIGVFLMVSITGLLVQKVAYNLSMTDFISMRIRYYREQQRFYFKNKETNY